MHSSRICNGDGGVTAEPMEMEVKDHVSGPGLYCDEPCILMTLLLRGRKIDKNTYLELLCKVLLKLDF